MFSTIQNQQRNIHRRHLKRVNEITGCEVDVVFNEKNEFNTDTPPITLSSAAGDGITNDTAAVQDAVDELLANNGGILIFPPGRYLLDSVKCGPGLTLWGYGATIVKPDLKFYFERYFSSFTHGLNEQELENRITDLLALANIIGNGEISRANMSMTHTQEELDIMKIEDYMSPEELVDYRRRITDALPHLNLDDTALMVLTYQLTEGRNTAKWPQTFRTFGNFNEPDKYLYNGTKDSAPIVFKGFCFEGNRENMGIYTGYELQQQHMIFLTAYRYSSGRLTAYLRDLSFRNGVADGISLYVNVHSYIRNIHATNVFRGGVTNTGGNSLTDMADIKADGDVHLTGIDWEIDGPSYVCDGVQMASPQYHTQVIAKNLDLAGDFDLKLKGGSFNGRNITVHGGPVNIYALDSTVYIRNSSFNAGHVLKSSKDDLIDKGHFSFLIQYPKNVIFENTTFQAMAPTENDLNDIPLAYYSMINLILETQYYMPRGNHLSFKSCTFLYNNNLPEGAETRVLSTGNDSMNRYNGVLFDTCTVEQGFDYGLYIGGGGWRL